LRDGGFIGVLCWEGGLVPKGLEQLEELEGNSTNRSTYNCPVVFRRVEGATARTILEAPDPAVHDRMERAAEELYDQGAAAITTSCGFNVILQERLSMAVPVPVFSSSLMQAPWILSICAPGAELIILTANGAAITPGHLEAAGVKDRSKCRVFGLEKNGEWNKIFIRPKEEVDIAIIKKEIIETAGKASRLYPAAAAILLECTDLPPFSDTVRQKTGLPVFDFVTMLRWISMSIWG
jgi:hypothetical protein